MRANRVLTVIDSHTCGQPTRLVVAGLPALAGRTCCDKRQELRLRHDWVRTAVCGEPRSSGHAFGAALVPSSDPRCQWGVLLFSVDGYPDMCGHATIGAATSLVELGMVLSPAPVFEFTLELPCGPIPVVVHTDDDRAVAVTFRNHPSYCPGQAAITAPDGSTVEIDIAFGGMWFAFVPAAAWGLSVDLERIGELRAAADDVRRQLARADRPLDPLRRQPVPVENLVWTDDARTSGADARNVAIAPSGEFDRAPCGTGTSARMAALFARGRLRPGGTFVNEGILGTRYSGRVAEVVDIGGLRAIVPEITGSAWLTGRSDIWVDPSDPVGTGFIPPGRDRS